MKLRAVLSTVVFLLSSLACLALWWQAVRFCMGDFEMPCLRQYAAAMVLGGASPLPSPDTQLSLAGCLRYYTLGVMASWMAGYAVFHAGMSVADWIAIPGTAEEDRPRAGGSD